jgi:hypothetical protein
MAPPVFISAEQFLVTANLGTAPAPGHAAGDDYLDLGTWTTFSGGEMDSSTQSVHPGGMNPPVVTGLTALVFSGMLKGLTHPEHDAESTDRANWSVVITPNGTFGRVTH